MESEPVLNRAQRKYQKRKQKQHEKKLLKKNAGGEAVEVEPKVERTVEDALQVEYVPVDPMAGMDESDPNYSEFAEIFRRFDIITRGKSATEALQSVSESAPEEMAPVGEDDGESNNEAAEAIPKKLSNRQKRLSNRVDIAELKGSAKRPDLVEIHDTTARDPFLLVELKAYRNTIPVPRHWGQKRKYLQGKRGIEKIPYQLPDFIRNTGIAELRQAALERAESQKLKAKQRERLRPKMGQLDVDYQVLHDAFFRYQSKPSLTHHGELYYEGKEFEPKTKDFVAGVLSENLKKALGMPDGAPPPWLLQMQQYGPPPSYPGLRVPGVNAPIPQGAKYGFHAGGWGRAPLDMNGRPIWGWADARVAVVYDNGGVNDYEPAFRWGAMLYADDYADDEEVEEDETNVESEKMAVDQPSTAAEPDHSLELDEHGHGLRKFQRTDESTAGGAPGVPRELFQVLQQQASSVGSAALGSSHTYAVPSRTGPDANRRTLNFLGSGGLKSGEIEITLDPSDFELSEDQLRQKYERLYREHEKQQLQPQGSTQLTDADRDELMRRSIVPKDKKDGKDKKKKDYVKF